MRSKKNTRHPLTDKVEKAYKNATGDSNKSGKKSLNDGKGNRPVPSGSKFKKSEKSDSGTGKTKSGFNRKSGPTKDRPDSGVSFNSGKTFGDRKRTRGKRSDSGTGDSTEYREKSFSREDKPKRGSRETKQKSFSERNEKGKKYPSKKTGSEDFSGKSFKRQSTTPRLLDSDSKGKDRKYGKGPIGDKQNPFRTSEDIKAFKQKKSSGSSTDFTRKTEKKDFSKPDYDKPGFKSKRKAPSTDGTIRLNKYIANAGICSRREADELITQGLISVNGKVITELGYKVQPGDQVKYEEKTLKREKLVYILINKPKDFITTMDDPQERKTVMELIHGACDERVYPVGRLDRNTTGLLLLTNDGELADKLTHPSSKIGKIYEVELDRNLDKADFDTIIEGNVRLFDGIVKVDEIAYLPKGKKHIGLEIHEGRNRIVRRLFEHLGYKVEKLDRTTYAGLTKKDLPRGHWRMLTKQEVVQLKYLG